LISRLNFRALLFMKRTFVHPERVVPL